MSSVARPFPGIAIRAGYVSPQPGQLVVGYEIREPIAGCTFDLKPEGWIAFILLLLFVTPLAFIPFIMPDCHQRHQIPIYGFPSGKAGPVPVAQEPAYHQAAPPPFAQEPAYHQAAPPPLYSYQEKPDYASYYAHEQQQKQQQQQQQQQRPPPPPQQQQRPQQPKAYAQPASYEERVFVD